MSNKKIFGASGYIAPRHMKAIKDTGNELVAALMMDSNFLQNLLISGNKKIEYIAITTPNYLHIRFALKSGAHAICEKPLVLNPHNIDQLKIIEEETGKKVLQLRLHDSIIALKEKISKELENRIYDLDLTYLTSRGKWYFVSWKGDEAKSGGIASNIGVHFFDMLSWREYKRS